MAPNRGWSVWWRFGRTYQATDSPDLHSPENDRHWKLETTEYNNRPHLDDATFFKVSHVQTKEKKGLTPEEFVTFDGGRLYAMENSRNQLQVNETITSDDEQEITDSWLRRFLSWFQCI